MNEYEKVWDRDRLMQYLSFADLSLTERLLVLHSRLSRNQIPTDEERRYLADLLATLAACPEPELLNLLGKAPL